jgi:hypothetical protein
MAYLATRDTVIKALGYFWNSVFLDSDFVSSYSQSISVSLAQLATEIERLPDYTSRFSIPERIDHAVRVFVFDEGTEDTAAYHYGDDGLVYGDVAVYGKDKTGTTDRRFQIDPDFNPEFLTTGINSPRTVWRKGQDYEIKGGWIRFFKDPLGLPELSKHPFPAADGQTLYEFLMWGFQVTEDINALSNFFGSLARYCGPSSPQTRLAIDVAWDLRVEGATVRNVNRMLSVLTDVDYVHDGGVVGDIYTEGDRVCVRTSSDVYTAPAGTTVLVSIGERLEADQLIFNSFVVRLGNEEIDFEEFEGLALDSQHLPSLAGGLLFVNDLVPVSRDRHPDWFTVRSQ